MARLFNIRLPVDGGNARRLRLRFRHSSLYDEFDLPDICPFHRDNFAEVASTHAMEACRRNASLRLNFMIFHHSFMAVAN
jgi:hypothetical protein